MVSSIGATLIRSAALHKTSNQRSEEISGVYTLIKPENPIPLVFDSPHSGTNYPKEFDYACDFEDLQRAEDKYVDELFADAPDYGAPLLSAQFPRTFIDVNRAADDIDEELLSAPWPEEETIEPTNRSHAGIGLVRRLITPGTPVYSRQLSPDEIKQRIETYYRPYHATFEALIESAHYNFGAVWHINCHSMPSPYAKGSFMRVNPLKAPDFVLGDRNGTSCDLDFTHAIRDFLKSKCYKVAINEPYKGVELVDRYSSPSTGRHSLQIEICRSLYMYETTGKKRSNFNKLKDDMNKLIEFCRDYTKSNLIPLAAD